MNKELIKQARRSLGLTQEELANEIGASLASVRNWEQGRCKVNRVAAKQIQKMLDSQSK
jgi:DNA-binding transcriptional regulator YiaG